ncbi:MAG: 3-dehydroquinate synthase [Lachnospiraceae bacterium]|nr:3-dehydroquinate synthase [Lachnospiraceae bacterium]
MTDQLTVKIPGNEGYDIVFRDSFDDLGLALSERGLIKGRKLVIVSDDSVASLYADDVRQSATAVGAEVCLYTFPHGEENKNLKTIEELYAFLIDHKISRKDLLIALGGGVTGDMTGFAAATFLRGIDFIQVPTSLLSMVDSSIGGKTGVDFNGYKNMVGAFHMPRLVYMNPEVLRTLPDVQFASGMAEILKHGLIKDAKYYSFLITHFEEINARDYETLKEMILRSCEIKKEVVQNDPFEKGERALLNFGHTLGHAIEKQSDFSLLHGQSVALGSICSAHISHKRGLISTEECYEIRDMFVPFGLPIIADCLKRQDIDAVIAHTKSDKKNALGKLKFILLEKIGKAFITDDVTEEEMKEALLTIIDEGDYLHE